MGEMEAMTVNYSDMVSGVFLDRPNRFIAHVELDGKVETVHVKNTGRCRELLPRGAKVYCQRSTNPSRKTKYDLIAVEKNGRLINSVESARARSSFSTRQSGTPGQSSEKTSEVRRFLSSTS